MLDKINGLFSGKRDRRNSEIPPVPPIKDTSSSVKLPSPPHEARISSLGSPLPTGTRVRPLTKMPTISPPVDSVHPALRSAPSLASVAPSNMTSGSNADYEGRRSLQALSEKLLGRALAENNPARKERLLSFAKVCTCPNVLLSIRASDQVSRSSMIPSSVHVKRKYQQRQLKLLLAAPSFPTR